MSVTIFERDGKPVYVDLTPGYICSSNVIAIRNVNGPIQFQVINQETGADKPNVYVIGLCIIANGCLIRGHCNRITGDCNEIFGSGNVIVGENNTIVETIE